MKASIRSDLLELIPGVFGFNRIRNSGFPDSRNDGGGVFAIDRLNNNSLPINDGLPAIGFDGRIY